jgi:hypothetical protein
MVGNIGRRGGFVPSALALLLLFRLLIPSGYMIAPDHHGRPGLTLCAASAAEPAGHAGHDGHPAKPGPSKSGERPCPFAALAAPPLPPQPPALAVRLPSPVPAPDLPQVSDRPRIAPAAPPPPATGPPLSV